MSESAGKSAPMPKKSDSRRDHFHGVLLVDKPSGLTSHDVVARIRSRFNFKKVGHGGTLDPMATGLLIILLGKKGTRLSQWVMGSDKVYEGVMQLGIATDTQDIDGKVAFEKDPSGISAERLEEEVKKWRGDIQQIPPMVSAIKKDGVPLYKMARKEQEIEREPRLRHVYFFRLHQYDPPYVRFDLKCSKGTYVRTLCNDIGEGLGCGAYLKELKRREAGKFSLENARPLSEILDMDLDELEQVTLPPSVAK